MLSNSNLRPNAQLFFFVMHAATFLSQNASFFTPQCYTLFAAYLYQKYELALSGNIQGNKLLPSHHRNNNKHKAPHYIPLPLGPSYSVSLSSFVLSAVAVGRLPFESSQGQLCTSCKERRLNYKTGSVRIDVTWRHVRLTIVAVEKQCVTFSESVSIAFGIQYEMRMRYIALRGLSDSTVIPRLTKIIRSGITFFSRNVISRRFL